MTIALFALVLMLLIGAAGTIALVRRRRTIRIGIRPRHPRRQPLLEDRLREAFEAPRAQYGEIFTSYMIWRRGHDTRLDLFTAAPWAQLNEFTRAIVVRHLWRSLERLARGAIVVVDHPPQRWSHEINEAFDDRGIDPWAAIVPATFAPPQFIKD